MDNTSMKGIATTHVSGDGDINVHIETDDGEVVSLRASYTEIRKLANMLLNQADISEQRSHQLMLVGNA